MKKNKVLAIFLAVCMLLPCFSSVVAASSSCNVVLSKIYIVEDGSWKDDKTLEQVGVTCTLSYCGGGASNHAVDSGELRKIVEDTYPEYKDQVLGYKKGLETKPSMMIHYPAYSWLETASITLNRTSETVTIFVDKAITTTPPTPPTPTPDPSEDEVTFTFKNLYFEADGSYSVGEEFTTITTTNDNPDASEERFYYVYSGITREGQDKLGNELKAGYAYDDVFSHTPTGDTFVVPDSTFGKNNSIYYNTDGHDVVYLHATKTDEPVVTHYNVIYLPGTDEEVDNMPLAEQVEVGAANILWLTAVPTREDGYTFTGWSDGKGNTYEQGSMVSLTGDLTLTALWNAPVVPDYTVSYAIGNSHEDDTVVGATGSFEYAENTLIQLPTPSRTSYNNWVYKFDGWDTGDDGIVDYAAGADYTVTGDVDFTAVWSLNTTDGNSVWDIADAMMIMGVYRTGVALSPEQEAASDYNSNGTCGDIEDAMLIMATYR